MADITYTPRAPGCEVRLTTSDGHELVVSLSGVKAAKGRAEGDTSLTGNLALVTLVSEYAANERAYRRLRSAEKRASHRRAAEREARDVEAIAEMISRRGTRTVTGWCSGCFAETRHRAVRGHQRPMRKFLCQGCGTPTTLCSAPGCDERPGAAVTLGLETARIAPRRRRRCGRVADYAEAAHRLDATVPSARTSAPELAAPVALLREAIEALDRWLDRPDPAQRERARQLALAAAALAAQTPTRELGGSTIIHLVQSVAVDLLRISGLDGADVQRRLADALAAAPPETRLRV